MDPDAEVRGAIALAFRVYIETGSACAVVQRFAKRSLRFPKCSQVGAWDSTLIWGTLTHGRMPVLLKDPYFASTCTDGRYQYCGQITGQGEVSKHTQRLAMAEWRVNLPAHDDG